MPVDSGDQLSCFGFLSGGVVGGCRWLQVFIAESAPTTPELPYKLHITARHNDTPLQLTTQATLKKQRCENEANIK
jgi:hypothetical protein